MSLLDKLMVTANKAVSAASVAANKVTVAGKAAANTAVKQTKTAAAMGKIKLEMASEEDKLKKAYTELGRIIFRDYESQAEADLEEYQPWFDKASEAKAQILALTAQMDALKAEAAKKEDSVAEVAVEAAEEDEDPSIYADFVEAQPAEVALAYEEAVEEIEEDAVETSDEDTTIKISLLSVEVSDEASEEPAEPEEEPVPEIPEVPTVGTLYVDVTGQE